jgi:hypothetical protein
MQSAIGYFRVNIQEQGRRGLVRLDQLVWRSHAPHPRPARGVFFCGLSTRQQPDETKTRGGQSE